MRVAAKVVAQAGADAIDLNMGCPVPKVCKTGAGAALLDDPDVAVAVARAARLGSGLPVTVKLRSGRRPGDTSGFELARRLVEEAGVAAIAFHPRSAAVHHKGVPDYELAARLVETLARARDPHRRAARRAEHPRRLPSHRCRRRDARARLARQPMAVRASAGGESQPGAHPEPSRAEVLAELDWTIDRAVEHLGMARATRYLRKFYPWYVARLGLAKTHAKAGRVVATGRRRLRTLAILLRSLRSARHAVPAYRRGFLVSPKPTRHPESHMPKDVILTPEGLDKLKDELELLSTAKRREVAERIKEAREFGDIAENAEYDDAKNEQAMLESRIATLQEKLRMATVIDSKEISTDVVGVGSVVHVKDEKTGKSVKYTIVGSAEANPEEAKLSNESPVGRALIGHKRGEIVAVQVPRGPARKLKITKIDVGLV